MRSLLLSALLIASGALAGQTLGWTFPTGPVDCPVGGHILPPCHEPWIAACLEPVTDTPGFNGSWIQHVGINACADSGMVTWGWPHLPSDTAFVAFQLSGTPPVNFHGLVIEVEGPDSMRMVVTMDGWVIADFQLSGAPQAIVQYGCLTQSEVMIKAYNGSGEVRIERLYALATVGPCITTGINEAWSPNTYTTQPWINVLGQRVPHRPKRR